MAQIEVGQLGAVDSRYPHREVVQGYVAQHHPDANITYYDPTSRNSDIRERTKDESLHLLQVSDMVTFVFGSHTPSNVSTYELQMALLRAQRHPSFPVCVLFGNPELDNPQLSDHATRSRKLLGTEIEWMENNGIIGEGQVTIVSGLDAMAQEILRFSSSYGTDFPRRRMKRLPSQQYPNVITGALKGRNDLITDLTSAHIPFTDTNWIWSVLPGFQLVEPILMRREYTKIVGAKESIIVQVGSESLNPYTTLGIALILSIANGGIPIVEYQLPGIDPKRTVVRNVYMEALADDIPPVHVVTSTQEVIKTLQSLSRR